MPVTIKREKAGRTHFAVSLAAAGNVTAWTEDRAKAGAFTGGEAKKVGEFYAGPGYGGTLTFLDGEKVLHEVGGAIPFSAEDDAASDAEHFRKQALALGEEVAELRAVLEANGRDAVQIQAELRKDIAELTAKNKELEALLAIEQ